MRNGAVPFYLKGKGYTNLAGVEISPEQVGFCKENVVSEVFLTTDLLSFLQQHRRSWDCIIMKDVIEHIPRQEVIPILGAAFETLTPAGRLLIETGNMASFTGPFLRYIDFTHESGFTEFSLRQVLRAVGFEEIQIGGAAPPHYSWASSLVFGPARAVWKAVLRMIYRVERGPAAVPQVLDKLLVACAVKPG